MFLLVFVYMSLDASQGLDKLIMLVVQVRFVKEGKVETNKWQRGKFN